MSAVSSGWKSSGPRGTQPSAAFYLLAPAGTHCGNCLSSCVLAAPALQLLPDFLHAPSPVSWPGAAWGLGLATQGLVLPQDFCHSAASVSLRTLPVRVSEVTSWALLPSSDSNFSAKGSFVPWPVICPLHLTQAAIPAQPTLSGLGVGGRPAAVSRSWDWHDTNPQEETRTPVKCGTALRRLHAPPPTS